MVRVVTIRVDEAALTELQAYIHITNIFQPEVTFEVVRVGEPGPAGRFPPG